MDEICLGASQQPTKILMEFLGWCNSNIAKYNINCTPSTTKKIFHCPVMSNSLHCQGRRQGGFSWFRRTLFSITDILKLTKHTMLSLGTLAINYEGFSGPDLENKHL